MTEAIGDGRNASSLIARGNGRSYGDASLNSAATLSTLRLDRLLAFDPVDGLLTAEAGLLLSDLLALFVPRGWFPPVTPGTRFVTLGGMLAADVHGKNHHIDGCFGDHVREFELLCGDGVVRRCSRSQNVDLFRATIGGMGLTGTILTVTLSLRRIETPWILQQTVRCRDLDETLAAFEAARSAPYSVAWIDCLAKGGGRGRALLYHGEHASSSAVPTGRRAPRLTTKPPRLRVPVDVPQWVLNGWTVQAFNALYYQQGRPGSTLIDYQHFFYPLDAIGDWNRLYGRRGFVQYQCVVPTAGGREALLQLLALISAGGSGSFLAVLKQFGSGCTPGQGGLLSFPMAGYTLAVDFPVTPAAFSLMLEMDKVVAGHGGRLYLAKDARMGSDMMRASYPDLDRFRAICSAVDPDRRYRSLLSERLAL
ncbi:FAD-binding oxidoreductase [Niveispirillum sp. SYP-B3756]|uniref:FAD-binding protein n=1 Tax=Niveispirillum sp. SYP-B3756 TaxID=2662178 RepID=UPI001B3C0757